jgi:arsenate reductase
MREAGVDLSAASTSKLTAELAERSQMLITMGCGDRCPVVPGLKRDDWPLEDPKGKDIARVRAIRDEIRQRVETLLEHEGWRKSL